MGRLLATDVVREAKQLKNKSDIEVGLIQPITADLIQSLQTFFDDPRICRICPDEHSRTQISGEMAKTATIKHNPLSNPRSRASRRQTSPGINADKSLKQLSPTRESNILAPRLNAGVSKRKGKVQKSSKQKQRDAKRQDRAEAVMEKMEVKVGQKVKRSKVINERKNEWGVVNGEGKEARKQAILGGAKDEEEDDWQDAEEGEGEGKMEEVVENGTMTLPAGPAQPELPVTNAVVEDETVDEADKIT